MSKRKIEYHFVDNECVDVHASSVVAVHLLKGVGHVPTVGDFVAIRLEAHSNVHHYDESNRILSVESKGTATVYLDAKEAAALRDRLTEAMEGWRTDERA